MFIKNDREISPAGSQYRVILEILGRRFPRDQARLESAALKAYFGKRPQQRIVGNERFLFIHKNNRAQNDHRQHQPERTIPDLAIPAQDAV